MFSGNDYTKFLSQNGMASPLSNGTCSRGASSAVGDARTHSANRRSPPATATPDTTRSPTTPEASGSPATPTSSRHEPPVGRLNDLTLDELLRSPGRAHLRKLDPKRPPGTLWFDDDPCVAATVRSIFERDFKEPHANWSQTPDVVLKRWFETFAQTYNWDREVNGRVKLEFEKKLKDRMSDQVCRWKRKWRLKGDEAMPRWLDPTVWAGLVRYWQDPKTEMRSANSRNARYHDPDGTGIYKHRSGQTSFKARARKHSEKTGETTPDFLVVLEETHRKPDGSFVDGKSASIYNEAQVRIQELESQLFSGDNMGTSPSPGLPVYVKNKIFTEVAPKKKNRIYGVGSLQAEASSAHTGAPPAPPAPPAPEDDPVLLKKKLAASEARYDAVFDYLAEKDPEFAAKFRARDQTRFEPAETSSETTATEGTGNEDINTMNTMGNS